MDLGSIPRPGNQGPFFVEFACSPRLCVGLFCVLRFPPTIQRHPGTPIGDAALPLVASVCLCICPVMDW